MSAARPLKDALQQSLRGLGAGGGLLRPLPTPPIKVRGPSTETLYGDPLRGVEDPPRGPPTRTQARPRGGCPSSIAAYGKRELSRTFYQRRHQRGAGFETLCTPKLFTSSSEPMADDDELDEEALMNNTLGAVVVPNSGAAAAADFARSHDEAQKHAVAVDDSAPKRHLDQATMEAAAPKFARTEVTGLPRDGTRASSRRPLPAATPQVASGLATAAGRPTTGPATAFTSQTRRPLAFHHFATCAAPGFCPGNASSSPRLARGRASGSITSALWATSSIRGSSPRTMLPASGTQMAPERQAGGGVCSSTVCVCLIVCPATPYVGRRATVLRCR